MNVGDNIVVKNENWRFSGNVAEKFDNHICKSVPLYEEGHDLICNISDWFIQDTSVVYDLGCSTGELLLNISERNKHRPEAKFIGIDIEQDMIDIANIKKQEKGTQHVQFLADDIMQFDFAPSDLIIANYTVMFIRPNQRQILLDRIYNVLRLGGAFIMFEKVRAADARFQDIMTCIYQEHKLRKGYSPEEIIGKSRSLKGVLEPLSTQGNMELLQRAGFNDSMSVMKMICFEGFLSIK